MTIERRKTICALLATTLSTMAAVHASAQTAPVRGLESLDGQASQANAQSPATTTPIPIPAAPTIVLPATSPPSVAERAKSPTREGSASRGAEDKRETAAPATRAPNDVPAREAVRSSAAAPLVAPTTPPASATPQPGIAPTETAAPSTPALQPALQAPQSTATPASTSLAAPETGRAMPLWLSLAVIVVVLAALWALRRRRPARPAAPVLGRSVGAVEAEPTPVDHTPFEPASPAATVLKTAVGEPAATPQFLDPRDARPVAAPVTNPTPRARLKCEFRPSRAGLNLLSAVVEGELIVTNTGDATAAAIRAGVSLLTAHAAQDADLVAFNASPVGRAATPPFALGAGETRVIRVVAALARDAIHTMTAANRPMFVPIVAANIYYGADGAVAQTARAWAVGVERVDSVKLAPFWLDAPVRMYDSVAARPHAASFES